MKKNFDNIKHNRVILALIAILVCFVIALISVTTIWSLVWIVMGGLIYLTLMGHVLIKPRPAELELLKKLNIIESE